MDRFPIVADDMADDAHGTGLPLTAEPPLGQRRGPGHDATMTRQVRQTLRLAVAAQIIRRCTQYSAVLHQRARHHARIAQFTVANRKIEAARDQIEHIIAELQLYAQLRMQSAELRQQWHEPPPAEAERRRYLQQPGNLPLLPGHRIPRLRELGHDAHRMGIQEIAFIGDRQPARVAVDQAHTQAPLETGQPLADHGQGQTQLGRRGGEAAERHDALEGLQAGQIVDAFHSQPFGYSDSSILYILGEASMRENARLIIVWSTSARGQPRAIMMLSLMRFRSCSGTWRVSGSQSQRMRLSQNPDLLPVPPCLP